MSRRGQIILSSFEQTELLDSERVVIVASHGPRGWPHSMPMWFTVREPEAKAHPDGPAGEIWIWTYAKSQKVKNLE
ncbi:MAG TPA: pyridoxamine 5'-phosphate oxidase family protein, partial [Solirubrobacterales bacterium]|nr:pyridoxamine 5'-phosphate oxidase family protein [Solirubrobacterales bacterium]